MKKKIKCTLIIPIVLSSTVSINALSLSAFFVDVNSSVHDWLNTALRATKAESLFRKNLNYNTTLSTEPTNTDLQNNLTQDVLFYSGHANYDHVGFYGNSKDACAIDIYTEDKARRYGYLIIMMVWA